VTRSITVREPEYDDRERALITASYMAEREPRNRYGVPLAEATDPDKSAEWSVPLPLTDFTEVAMEKAQEAHRASGEVQYPNAQVWRVERGG